MLGNATAIATLKVRSSVADRIALRHSIDRQLQGSELTPDGLPPSAVLIVRQLRDPMPGRLAVRADRVRAPPPWAAAVRDTLRDLLAAAARPGSSSGFSETAPAVLFADEAELIACLTLDLVRGQAGARWWWRRIGVAFPELAVSTSDGGASALDPCRLLVARARDMPSVFACLAQWGAAVEVIATFDHRRTCELLRAIASAHQVDPLVIALASPSDREPAPAFATTNLTSISDLGLDTDTAPAPTDAEPVSASLNLAEAHTNSNLNEPSEPRGWPEEPWLPWLPSAAAHHPLSPGQRFLLGVALALQAAPVLVRQPGFVRRAQTWWHHQERIGRLSWWHDDDNTPASDARDSVLGVASDSSAWPPDGIDPHHVGVADEEMAPARPSDDAVLRTLDQPQRPRRERHPDERTVAEESASADAAVGDAADSQSATVGTENPDRTTDAPVRVLEEPLKPAEPGTEPQQPQTAVFPGEQFRTHLGGVLYLIHALEALEIPMVFEQGWGLASRLGPWGTLDLIARALLGDRFADVADDAIWGVLTGLSFDGDSERSAESTAAAAAEHHSGRPKRQFAWSETTPDYRAPNQWRTALAEPTATLHWTAACGRLWLWSCKRYLLASVRRNGQRPAQQACAESAVWLGNTPAGIYRSRIDQAPLSRFAHRHGDADLCAWATAAAPAVARRLYLALDIEFDDRDALWRLLSVEGHLYVSSSHVDLVADIDQIWLSARRAGLDRNPGWLADYGRVVLFHFR